MMTTSVRFIAWLESLDTSLVRRPHKFLSQTKGRAAITAYLQEVNLVVLEK